MLIAPPTIATNEAEFVNSLSDNTIALNNKKETQETITTALAEAKKLPSDSEAIKTMSTYDGRKGLSGADVYLALFHHAKLSFGEGYSAQTALRDAKAYSKAPKKTVTKKPTEESKPLSQEIPAQETQPTEKQAIRDSLTIIVENPGKPQNVTQAIPEVNICDPALDFPTAVRQFLKSLGRSNEWIHNKQEQIEWVTSSGKLYDLNGRYTSGSYDNGFHEDFGVSWSLLRKVGPDKMRDTIYDCEDGKKCKRKEVWIEGYSVDHTSLLKYLEPIKKECSLTAEKKE